MLPPLFSAYTQSCKKLKSVATCAYAYNPLIQHWLHCNGKKILSTVQRIVSTFDATGQVSKKRYSLRMWCEAFKASAVHNTGVSVEKPDTYLWEIKQELNLIFNLDICESSICKLLKKSNSSWKKLVYNQHNLIFVDETGCDCRDAIRKYGYGLRGKPARCSNDQLDVTGDDLSTLTCYLTCMMTFCDDNQSIVS